MSHIVFAWEQGRNYGHILRFLPVAKELRARGHEVSFCLRDVSRAEAILGREGFRYYQAPIWLPKVVGLPPTLSYADLMLRHGFLEPDALASLVHAWRRLFDALSPDLLVLDFAAASLVASQGLDIPRTLIGTGFFIPPVCDPLPSMRWWEPPQRSMLEKLHQRVHDTANQVLERIGQPHLDRLSQLFEVEEAFLCTVPELDHYPSRPDVHYWGPLMSIDEGEKPSWPGPDGRPRVFVYLQPDFPGYEPLLTALGRMPVSALVFAPGLVPAQARKPGSANVHFASRPVCMSSVLAMADLVVTHGSFGTTAAALLSGVPCLLLPSQLEQRILAHRCDDLGVSLSLDRQHKNPNYRKTVDRLLDDPSFRGAARALSEKYGGLGIEGRVQAISDRLIGLLQT